MSPSATILRRATQAVVIRPIAPTETAPWDEYVRGHDDGTFFHTQAWRYAVKEAFGHEDIYLVAMAGDRIVGVLPMFYIHSGFGGRMLVSVPYGVGGGIIADGEEIAADLFAAAKRIATDKKCTTIDLRSARANVEALPIIERYAGFRRTMPENPEDVLGWLPRKARAAARNGRKKFQLNVAVGDEHLREVWRLYTISMRRLGSLAYPYRFFESLIVHTHGAHWVSLVRWSGRSVAGLVTFGFRDTVLPYFIGTTRQAKACSAANFIYLSAMERGAADGFRVFDFGRSRCDNAGSFDFKRFHGFIPQPLEYQRYVAPGASPADLTPNNPKFRLARSVWRYLPMGLTRLVGGRLARHIPG